jgi:EAL domain-containing protein (putative c-di-GMP-specific phosphodiesterase class I)
MQTQLLDERTVDIPWLEYHLSGGSAPQRTSLDSFPFVLGRSEAADLQIDSTLVSRTHATIVRTGDRYRVQDSGSTNGTILNGKRIDEATIANGDVLSIANLEFTFHCGGLHPFENATQVMPVDSPDGNGFVSSGELILGVRRCQELILHGAVRCDCQPIVCLGERTVFGYALTGLATGRVTESPEITELITRSGGPLMRRLLQLLRHVAIEQNRNALPDGRVFLPFVASELVRDGLVGELKNLRDSVDSPGQIVVQVPANAARELPGFSRTYRAVRQLELAIAYEDFSGGQSHVYEMTKLVPDFVKLSPNAIRGIEQSRERQRRMSLLIQSILELGCDVVAVGIENDREADIVADLGCRLAQRRDFEPPSPVKQSVKATAR